MISAIIFLAISTVCIWALTPRIFRIADYNCARKHLEVSRNVRVAKRLNMSNATRSIDEFFATLARLTRAQTPAREALTHTLTLLPSSDIWQQCAHQLDRYDNLDNVMQVLQRSRDEIAVLLSMAYMHQSFNAEALDQAASVVRTREQMQQSLSAATAQARITARILTALPLILLIVALVASSSFRHLFFSPLGVVIAVIGGALNRLGAWWISILTKRVQSHARPQHIVQLVDSFCVAIKCGLSVTQACTQWEHINDVGASVAHHLKKGHSLRDALQMQQLVNDPFGLQVINTLVSAHLDGLPVHSTAHSLAQQARAAQQANTDVAIRQLPSKLSFPLVLCVLPSFMLLTVAPMILANLSRLHTSLPSPLS